MTTPELQAKIDRLPAWARAHVKLLESRVKEANHQRDRAREALDVPNPGRIRMRDYLAGGYNGRPVEGDPDVLFDLSRNGESHRSLTASVETGRLLRPRLRIAGDIFDASMVVIPESSNVIHIEFREDR